MVDLAALGVLALAAFIGWRRGTRLMALWLAGLVGGYFGALVLARPIGGAIGRAASIPAFLVYPIAGLAILMAITMLVKIPARRLARERAFQRADGWTPTTADGVGGAALAAVAGAGVVVVVAWAATSVRGLLDLGVTAAGVRAAGARAAGTQAAGSLTARLSTAATRQVVYAVARQATGDRLAASMLAAVAADPAEGAQAVSAVLGDPRVRGMWTDAGLRDALVRGDVGAVAANPAVRALTADARLREAAQRLGLLDAAGGGGAASLAGAAGAGGADQAAAQLVEHLAPLVRSVQSLQSDPEFRRMLADPGLRERLEQGNVAALMSDPQFNQMAARVLERLRVPVRAQ